MTTLRRSKDRKVTNSATPSGNVRIANTFGLPSGKSWSCPGMTSVCGGVCYAGRLERVYKGVSNVLVGNFLALDGQDVTTMTAMLRDMVADFVADCDKHGAEPVFRIHWDGDFFSVDYARAWLYVIAGFQNVRFWVYTRNVDAAVMLHAQRSLTPNLSLYFSADEENMDDARRLQADGVRLAVLGTTFAHAADLYGSKRAARCPEQTGQLDLITPEGGACVRCGLCPLGKADILFSITGK